MICTSIEQSRKLVELGIDPSTADMCWCNNSVKGVNYTDEYAIHTHTIEELKSVFDEALKGWDKYWEIIPAWSLDALLKLIPLVKEDDKDGGCQPKLCRGWNNKWHVYYRSTIHITDWYDTPLDAAFEMICWLKENKHI